MQVFQFILALVTLPAFVLGLIALIGLVIQGKSTSEVIVGIDHGLKHDSAVNLDHIQTVSTSRLARYVGSLDGQMMSKVCLALTIATGCD